MIPAQVCSHFWPRLKRQCDAGLRAPNDCDGCPAYADGTAYLGVATEDQERSGEWAHIIRRRLPRANFREYTS